MASFISHFCVLRSNKAFISCVVVLSSACVMLCYEHDAQLFLWPQHALRREHGPLKPLSEVWHLLEITILYSCSGLLSLTLHLGGLPFIVVSVIALSHSFTQTKCRCSTLFLVIIFTCWCMASVLVISLSLQQSSWVLPSGNAVLCGRPNAQLFI